MDHDPFTGMFYTTFLAELCRQREVKTYLEIGVQKGINLQSILAEEVYAVDPDFDLQVDPTRGKRSVHFYRGTSDSFFSSSHAQDMVSKGLDFAFLDGMHLFEFLLRDILNTEACSKRGGLIALHDCLPFNSEMIERIPDTANRKLRHAGAWTGDVWKVVPILQKYRPDLKVLLVDCEPTGLVFITNLNPSSTVLKTKYLEIVQEFNRQPNDSDALENYYSSNTIIPASEIVRNFNQSSFFMT